MKKKWLNCFVIVALFASSTSFSLPSKVGASAPSGYTLTYSDEFNDTTVNASDWIFRTGSLYAGGYNRQENVSESGGSLHIAFKKEDFNNDGNMEYTGGGLISKHNFGYGYYETRAKLLGGVNGFHQSFWSMGLPYLDPTSPQYDDLVDAGLMPYYGRTVEIDGFEQDSNHSGYYKDNGHVYLPTHTATGAQQRNVDTTDWFTVGYEWLPGQVKFYLNGTLVRTMPFSSLYGQSNFWLTGLANNVHSGTPGSVPAGSEALYDYFKFYTINSGGTNRITNGGFEYNNSSMNLNYPMGWLEYGDADSSKVLLDASSHSGSYVVNHVNASTGYTVTTKQNVENIPNGPHKLTAWVKSSGGQTEAKMRVLNYGGSELTYNIPLTGTWTEITLDNINVTTNKALIAFTSVAQAGQWLKVDDVKFEDKTVAPIREAENLIKTTSAGDSQTNYSDAPASGGAYNNLNANAVNDYIEYTVNIPAAGTYAVSVGNRVAFNKGIYQLSIDGVNTGSTVDEYSAASGYNTTSFGSINFATSGNKLFRFKVTGKNAGSSGYQLGIDYIKIE